MGDGFRVHTEVFTAAEVAELRDAVESAVVRATDLVESAATAHPDRLTTCTTGEGRRLQAVDDAVGGYTVVHWEAVRVGSPRSVRNLRPVTHLDHRLDVWDDPRLTTPAAQLLGVDAVTPLTSKITVKRARIGSEFVWHQDHAFLATYLGHEHAAEVIIAMVVLDDADAGNGALWLVPGTHRGRARADHAGPRPEDAAPVRVDAPAGTVVFFPSLMVHRSDANRSDRDRRALFLLYQPAGRPHLDEGSSVTPATPR